jgi:hypothetical protein
MHGSKKRSRRPTYNDNYQNSSDPPLFSSDGPDAGAENYTSIGKRRKRMFQGPWWGGPAAEGAHSMTAKRPFQRNFDSGVFMGSDTTATENEDAEGFPCLRSPSTNQREPGPDVRPGEKLAYEELKQQLESQGIFPDEDDLQDYLARQHCAMYIVLNYADRGCPYINLTNLGLHAILDSTLRPLHCLVRQEQDEPLAPDLRLYLGNNDLSHLPNELYALQHLKELSIRGNQVKHLAPQLGRLPLEELNLSFNRIRYLPYAMLRLFRNAYQRSETISEFLAAQFHLQPNPFVVPVCRNAAATGSRLSLRRNQLTLAARSVPCYLTIAATPLRPYAPWPSQQDTLLLPANVALYTPPNRNYVPSLFELCLRSAKQHRRISAMLTFQDLPPAIEEALVGAEQLSTAGPLYCDVCEQEYIVPRGEWLEWYAGVRDNEHDLIPFLRRVCSWGCVGAVFDEKDSCAKGDEDDDATNEEAVSDDWLLCGWREASP